MGGPFKLDRLGHEHRETMKQCDSCLGLGQFYVAGGYKTCIKCNGKGAVNMTLEDYFKTYGLSVQSGTLSESRSGDVGR